MRTMNPLFYEYNLKKQNTQHIIIKTEIPHINTEWIKKTIKKFLEENNINKTDLTLSFKYQPIKNKIISCKANLNLNTQKTIIKGEGRDEYNATKNMLENLDVEIKTNNYKKHTLTNPLAKSST